MSHIMLKLPKIPTVVTLTHAILLLVQSGITSGFPECGFPAYSKFGLMPKE